jgi:hypothetical protein
MSVADPSYPLSSIPTVGRNAGIPTPLSSSAIPQLLRLRTDWHVRTIART